MATTIPDWINSDFLQKALRTNEEYSNITVTSCKAESAAAAGKNFSSELYRVTLETEHNGKTEQISVIVKCAVQTGQLSQMLEDSGLFPIETAAFTKILPQLLGMLEKAVGDTFRPFAPKCLYTSTDPVTIIMEDLNAQEFKLATVTHGLDLKHCLLVMKTIAQYHAASMVLHSQDPDLFQPFMEIAGAKNLEMGMKAYFSLCVRSLREHVEKWPGYEKHAENLRKIEPNAFDAWYGCMVRDDKAFNVPLHGDLWLNNLMFRYSKEDRPEDIRLIDFQRCYLSSPAVDLMYFMTSSAAPEVLENYHILIDEYYKTLSHTLSSLGHQDLQPTRATLDAELEKKQIYGVLISCIMRPVSLVDKSNVPDVENIFSSDFSLPMSESYRETMKELLPLYEKWGWFKCN